MKEQEPLLPPWVFSTAKFVIPFAVVIGLWKLLGILNIPGRIAFPILVLPTLVLLVYFGGRLYKPFRVDKATGRCIAKGAQERASCRHYIPGAKLGGGCGRLREDRRCRYVKR